MSFLSELKRKAGNANNASAAVEKRFANAGAKKETENTKTENPLLAFMKRRKEAEKTEVKKDEAPVGAVQEEVIEEEAVIEEADAKEEAVNHDDNPENAVAEEDVVEEVVEEIVEEEVAKEEPAEEEIIEEEPIQKEATQKETAEEEPAEAEEETAEDAPSEESVEEETAEEEPKPKKKAKKAVKKTESQIPVSKETVENATISTPDDMHSFEFDTVDIYGEKVDFDTACSIATSQFIDETWIAKRDEINAKVKAIKLKDMKPGAAFYIAEEIDAVLDDIDDDYKRLNATMKLLTDSSCGIGTVIRKHGAGKGGKNTQERDAAGLSALLNAKINGKPLNLIQLLAAVTIRLSFYQDTIKRLEQKRSALNIAASESRASAALAQ